MSRWRTRGSNGDSHASISDLSSETVVLKVFAILNELWLLLKDCAIFVIFAAVNVERRF